MRRHFSPIRKDKYFKQKNISSGLGMEGRPCRALGCERPQPSGGSGRDMVSVRPLRSADLLGSRPPETLVQAHTDAQG